MDVLAIAEALEAQMGGFQRPPEDMLKSLPALPAKVNGKAPKAKPPPKPKPAKPVKEKPVKAKPAKPPRLKPAPKPKPQKPAKK